MYDSNGIVSFDVHYSLSEQDGLYYLTISPSAEWMNAKERLFPVVIDPTIAPVYASEDSYVDTNYLLDNYGSSSHLWIRYNRTTYIKCAPIDLPPNAIIDSAYLDTHYFYLEGIDSGKVVARAYQALDDWSEDTITAASYIRIPDNHLDQVDILANQYAKPSSPGDCSINIKQAVSNWLAGDPNYGIVLKYFQGPNLSVILYSSETITYTPSIVVTYTIPTPSYLESGVYFLRNYDNNKYMDTTSGGFISGTQIQQYGKSAPKPQNQLYKINYVSTNADGRCYTIRPATNSQMGLSADGTGTAGSITLQPISATNSSSSVSNDQLWVISPTENGYSIKNRAHNKGYITVPNNTVNGAELITSSVISSKGEWLFEAYTGTPITGYGLQTEQNSATLYSQSDTIYVAVDTTTTLHGFMYSTVLNHNGPVIYSITNPAGTEESIATIVPGTNQLIAHNPGTVTLSLSYAGAPFSVTYTVRVVSEIVGLDLDYDGGYNSRYSNAPSRILSQVNILQEKYLETFDIYVKVNTLTCFQSLADTCPSTDFDTHCTCGGYDASCQNSYLTDNNGTSELEWIANELHHKNIHNVTAPSRINYEPGSSSFKIIYLGHVFCERIGDSLTGTHDTSHNTTGLAYKDYSFACVFNRTGGVEGVSEFYHEAKTLVHEFGHLQCALDHYYPDSQTDANSGRFSTELINNTFDNPEFAKPNDVKFSSDCIYGEKKNFPHIANNLTICNGCKWLIDNKIEYP